MIDGFLRIGKSKLTEPVTPAVNSEVDEPFWPSVDGEPRSLGSFSPSRFESFPRSPAEGRPLPPSRLIGWSMKFQSAGLAVFGVPRPLMV